MKNSTKFSGGVLAIGVLILGYLAKTLGDRGIYADTSGTSGYTTNFEVFLLILGITLCIGGFIKLMMSLGKS